MIRAVRRSPMAAMLRGQSDTVSARCKAALLLAMWALGVAAATSIRW